MLPEEVVKARKPDYVAPLVVLLCSDKAPEPTGGMYEAGCGWQAKVGWQRSGGYTFSTAAEMTPEAVARLWPRVTDFDDGRADSPQSMQEGRTRVFAPVAKITKI